MRANKQNPDDRRFKLTIAYDGTDYAGWQVQKGETGVQEKIEQAFGIIFPSVKRIHSSSRTDAGVHAMGMMAHVDIPRAEFKMSPDKLTLAINANLPPDIRIVRAVRCPGDFHARFDAKGKQYRYFIWNDRAMNPLLNRTAWQVPRKLNVAAMRQAAGHFLGRKDFKSLAANRAYEMETTVRTLTRCDVRQSGRLLTVIIEGDGFLYKMCRGIVGTLLEVGYGKLLPVDVKGILKKKCRTAAGVNVPAQGLVLWKVYYSKPGRRPSK